jgi:hypothetical protein
MVLFLPGTRLVTTPPSDGASAGTRRGCEAGVARFDLRTESGTVARYLTKGNCYALSVIFVLGVVVETGRLAAAP